MAMMGRLLPFVLKGQFWVLAVPQSVGRSGGQSWASQVTYEEEVKKTTRIPFVSLSSCLFHGLFKINTKLIIYTNRFLTDALIIVGLIPKLSKGPVNFTTRILFADTVHSHLPVRRVLAGLFMVLSAPLRVFEPTATSLFARPTRTGKGGGLTPSGIRAL